MNGALRIAREEWRLMRRNRVAVLGFLLFAVLAVTAIVSAHDHVRSINADRARHQAEANHQFEAQPDRHPHRVVHYGHFVFRPLDPLAAFDPGVDAYTGNTLFLEGHRQNTATFSDARQSSLLLRFGRLAPALVLQVLAPLLLIFIAYGAVARERERGTLRLLLAQGTSGGAVVAGKLFALMGLSALVLSPALIALVWTGVTSATHWPRIGLLAGGYAIWLLIWSLAIVLASSMFARARDALLALLAIWAVSMLLVPRLLPDVANSAHSLPTKFETDIAVERDLVALGDPHDPNDPNFAPFRQKLLDQYGVSRVEDLPVNYIGVLAVQGEKDSSDLYNRYIRQAQAVEDRQLRLIDRFSVISPTVALQRLSMIAAGSDLLTFRDFMEQAEAYRYAMVQTLNQLEADVIRYADDNDPSKENRIDRTHWSKIPEFAYRSPDLANTLDRAASPALVLLGWLIILAAVTVVAARRLGRRAQ